MFVVPGYGGDEGSVAQLVARLRDDGRDVHVVVTPSGGRARMEVGAKTLDDAVRAAGAKTVDVVGFSAGGIVVRTWLALDGGATRTRHAVLVGAPNHGSEALRHVTCTEGCMDLLPGSALLRQLAGALPAGPDYVAFWTANDTNVTPPTSAMLEGARNVKVQDACIGMTADHLGLVTDWRVLALVVGAARGVDVTCPT